MSLEDYRKKRDFGITPEPEGKAVKSGRKLRYFIQRHAATRLHYDFRLELNGVLLSWAVPKGPSLDPHEKRLAMHVEDHPVSYGTFEGVIPKGQYGAGTVLLWDRGTWTPEGDADAGLVKGHLEFTLDGEKLHGRFHLVKLRGDGKGEPWLLMKRTDEHVSTADITADRPESVARTEPKNTRDLPLFVKPQLCTAAEAPPEGDGWLHELKLDGYRLQARIQDGKCRLLTRNAQDWTSRFGAVAKALAALPCEQALLDGEIVSLDVRGMPRFQRLANGEGRLVYFAFDLLHLDGDDLRELPLRERKARLRELIGEPGIARCLDHVEGGGDALFEKVCAMGLEGEVAKRADAPYTSARTLDWLKIKCQAREDFTIVGWTDPKGSRSGFGALVLGEAGRYVGKVGTGFDEATLADLHARVSKIGVDAPSVEGAPRIAGVHWVEPRLRAAVRFTERTDDGILRHPVFLGLREDLPMDRPAQPSDVVEGIRITHPERLVFPGITKLELAQYYARVADRMLPEVAGRPISVIRCPKGFGANCFFHRHPAPAFGAAVRSVDADGETWIYIEDRRGLVALARAGVIEIHPWGSRIDALHEPDRIVMDLDPDAAVGWDALVDGAERLRAFFDALGLQSFARVTGGKGLHVVVPIAPKHDWAVVKLFCKGVADLMERDEPRKYVAQPAKAARKGRIFVDYLRNGFGATAVASWSVRAREGAPVAVPVGWDELRALGSGSAFTLTDVERRRTRAAWDGFSALKQALTVGALKAV